MKGTPSLISLTFITILPTKYSISLTTNAPKHFKTSNVIPEYTIVYPPGVTEIIVDGNLRNYYDKLIGNYINAENVSMHSIQVVEQIYNSNVEMSDTIKEFVRNMGIKAIAITCKAGKKAIVEMLIEAGHDVHSDNEHALLFSVEAKYFLFLGASDVQWRIVIECRRWSFRYRQVFSRKWC